MADDHSAQEGALLERWADANDAEGRKKWFQDASRFLMGLPEGGHWFCLHYEVAQRMCELALYHEHEDVQKLFGCIGSSLGDCLDCVDRYHEAQKSYTDADGGDVILHACLCFDAIRLTGLLTGAMDVKAHEDISFKVRSAIHEVLTYSEILEDSEVCSLCSRALLHIDHTHGIDAVIGEGAFYVGVFRLLAHNEESVRQLMRRAADLLPVPTGEYLTALLPLLDKWRHVLEFGLFYGDCDQGLGGGTLMQRVKVFQMKSSLWMGLASVLERILEGGELHNISDGVSALVPIVFQHCNSECSPDVFTWALSSAKMLLDGLKSKIWCSSHLAPLQVAEVFICSSYTGKANTRTHKLCISALSSLLASVESASMLDELEVLRQRVLYFFINQVQASKNFGRVIRAIAQQEAYKRLCQSVKDALPPTSAAHIYGPALIGELVREETQQGGLADRVQASAVEYASLILQVDACILRVLLSSDQVHRDAPSQLLIADGIGNDIEATCEVAVEYKETWRCAPMLWLDLAKCKHPMVSCALLVSAAHLSWVQVNREHLHKEQATKERRVSGGFLINKLESKLEASPMGMLNSIMAWRPCQGWDDAWSRIDIEMKQCPDLLLLKWLEIAVQHLEVLSREKFYPPAEFECRMWSSIVRLATGPDTSLRKAANQWIECSQSKLMIDDDESGGFIGILSGCFSALIELKQIPAEEVAVLPQTAHFFDFLTGLIGVDNPNTHIAAIKTVVKDSWDLVHTVLNTCKALPISNFSRRAVQCSLSSAFKLLVPLYSFRIRNRDKHGGLMVGNEFLRMMWEWGQKQLAQTTCCVWADATCEIGQLFVKSGASTKLPHEVVPLAKEVLKIRGDIDHEKLIKLWSLLGEDAPGNLAEPLFDFLTVKDRGVQDVVDLTESISDDDWATKSGTQRKHSNGSIIGPLASPIVVGTSPDLHLSKQVLDEVQHLPSTEGDADRVSLSQLCNSAFPPVLVSRSPINKAIDATGNAENAKHLGTSKGSSDSDVRKSWAMYERAKSQRGVQGLKQATALSRSCANADDGGPGARAVQCADLERGPSVQSGSGCQQDSSGQLQSLYPFLPSKATKQGGRLAPPSAGQGPKGTIFISPLKGPQGRVVGLPMRPGANTYARPTCSMEAVFEKILAWRIDAIKSEKSDLMFGRRAQVPKVFSTLQQYTNAFEMLLVEELRATLHQGWVELEEGVSSPMSIPVRVDHVQRAPPFYNVTFLLEAADALDRRVVHVDNLLILTDRPLDTKNLPSRHMLALVTNNSNSGNDGNSKLVDMKIKAEGSGTASSHTSRDASYYLRKGSHWHATLLDSLVPHFRQLQALCNLYALPQQLVNTILHPTPPPNSVDLEGTMLPRSMLRALQEVYNPTQQAAIASAVAGRGVFTLVQGPPGTGKTSVIVGMVSALLVSLCSKGPEPRTALEAKRDPAQCHRPTRILICAQSNAAADELLSRISRDGVTCLDGSKRTPTMLRMGRLEETHESVKAFHIKHMCTAAMQKNEDASEATLRTAEHVKQLDELQQQLKQVREEVQRLRSSPLGNNGREPIKPLQGKERQLNSEARKLRSQLYQDNKDVQHHEKHIRRRTLADAEIVVSTLGSAGGDLTSLCTGNKHGEEITFNALIIDEAAQAVEPAALVPLGLLSRAARVILVGDTKQLPATVISQAAQSCNLGRSMIERFESAGYPSVMLSEQYRMHPEISRFPSKYFYNDQLKDGAGISVLSRGAPYHNDQHRCFRPMVFFDCIDGIETRGRTRSMENALEADLAVNLFMGIRSRHPNSIGSVAIITPYRGQLACLKDRLRRAATVPMEPPPELSTVDGFQGREADIVIVTLVRAKQVPAPSIGFVNDIRRMNVSLTRPRQALWVIGHLKTLCASPAWSAFLDDAQNRDRVITARKPFSRLFDASHSQKCSQERGQEATGNAWTVGERPARESHHEKMGHHDKNRVSRATKMVHGSPSEWRGQQHGTASSSSMKPEKGQKTNAGVKSRKRRWDVVQQDMLFPKPWGLGDTKVGNAQCRTRPDCVDCGQPAASQIVACDLNINGGKKHKPLVPANEASRQLVNAEKAPLVHGAFQPTSRGQWSRAEASSGAPIQVQDRPKNGSSMVCKTECGRKRLKRCNTDEVAAPVLNGQDNCAVPFKGRAGTQGECRRGTSKAGNGTTGASHAEQWSSNSQQNGPDEPPRAQTKRVDWAAIASKSALSAGGFGTRTGQPMRRLSSLAGGTHTKQVARHGSSTGTTGNGGLPKPSVAARGRQEKGRTKVDNGQQEFSLAGLVDKIEKMNSRPKFYTGNTAKGAGSN